jgi:hypothetical protein
MNKVFRFGTVQILDCLLSFVPDQLPVPNKGRKTEEFNISFKRGSTHRWNGAISNKTGMVWLHFSPFKRVMGGLYLPLCLPVRGVGR